MGKKNNKSKGQRQKQNAKKTQNVFKIKNNKKNKFNKKTKEVPIKLKKVYYKKEINKMPTTFAEIFFFSILNR